MRGESKARSTRMTVTEGAAYLRVSRATMWRLIATGRIRKFQVVAARGSRAFVYLEDLDCIIDAGTDRTGSP
jgi:excisionase family DNA binding protein